MTDLLANIDRNKRLCTGVGLGYDAPPDLMPQIASESEFKELLLAYDKLVRERLHDDIAFLRSVDDHATVARFLRVLYNLRTATAHDDNTEANAFYADWTRRYVPWQTAASELAKTLVSALEHLDRISGRVRRDPKLSASWKERAAIATEAIFQAVCDDLHLTFTPANTKRMIYNVDKLAAKIPASANVRAEVESLCAQEITAQRLRLPVPYYEVLDNLGLMRGRQARAALLVAYSIASSTQLSGDAFLARVVETWKVASS